MVHCSHKCLSKLSTANTSTYQMSLDSSKVLLLALAEFALGNLKMYLQFQSLVNTAMNLEVEIFPVAPFTNMV